MSCFLGIETNCDECRMCYKEEQNTEIHNNDTSNKKGNVSNRHAKKLFKVSYVKWGR